MVTVIVPIYNVEKYIRDCIDSVIHQTYTELEIILVDDGSTDNCGRICEEYAKKDNRIIVIHKENGGLSDARNTGLAIANGDYIYFLDSDDYIRKDAMEKLVTHADSVRADIIFFDSESFTEDNSLMPDVLIHKGSYPPSNGANTMLRRYKNNEFFFGAPLHFYRAGFLKQNKLRFKKNLLYEDLLFSVMAYLSAKRVFFLKESLYFRRIRQGSILTLSYHTKNYYSYSYCFKRFLKKRRELHNNSVKKRAIDESIKYSAFHCLEVYAGLEKEEKKEVEFDLNKIRKQFFDRKYRGTGKLKIEMTFPRLYSSYRNTLWPVKEWMLRRKETFFNEKIIKNECSSIYKILRHNTNMK